MPAEQRRFRVRRTEPTTELFSLAGVYVASEELDRVRENAHGLGHVTRAVRTRSPGADGRPVAAWALYVWAAEGGRPRRPRGGRPRAAVTRGVSINVHLTPAEKRLIEERAARLGRDAGAYLRELGLGSARGVRVVEVPAVNREAHGQLRRLGVNLNQVAARLNETAADGGRPELGAVDRALLEQIRAAVLELQSALVGRTRPAEEPDA